MKTTFGSYAAIAKPLDLRDFRLSQLKRAEYRYTLLLLYWPLYLLAFMTLERIAPAAYYHPVHCALDDMIPFCEWFVIPYLAWYGFLFGVLGYTFFREPQSFIKAMRFMMITYTVALIAYIIYPNCQQLRPEVLPRDNIASDIVRFVYWIDTPTNVSPSIHVIGSAAFMFTALDTRRFSGRGWRIFFIASAALISVSILFMKQHSAIDLFAALPVCLVGWLASFAEKSKSRAIIY